jgi:type IV pilus assembly protein PilB
LTGLSSIWSELLAQGEEGAARTVDALFDESVRQRASDIYLEPWQEEVAVRFRVDGIIHDVALLPLKHHARLVGRLKVLSNILTYQREMPQDGRIDAASVHCKKAMRVSTVPTVYGEKFVIRILDVDPRMFTMDALGFRAEITESLRQIVRQPYGVLLLTGPASSGKTTTIYALLNEILTARQRATHMVTLEDPVEYRLGNVTQCEVNPHGGFTFGVALRALLRQDPEVIMVGEIRDAETASTAIQAGLTGHFVISTVHSGSAAGVFTRLLDMGVEPFLASSAINGVLAQRLVRRICPDCRQPDTTADPVLKRCLGITEEAQSFYRGTGCEKCFQTGYLGRLAIGELLTVNETLSEIILARSRTSLLHQAALDAGMIPMLQDGLARVREGVTTLEELRRVLPTRQVEPEA